MSWKYSDKEYIKIFRKMLNWEWYTDVNTTKLFLHCLLKANWKDGTWRGYKYKRGQFITSLQTLARETGLTIRQIRTGLKHLKSTGEVTDWHDSKIRIITVNFYDQYQGSDKPSDSQMTGKSTGKRQASDNRYKNNKEHKEEKENKEALPMAVFGDDDDDDEKGWGFE